MTDLNEKNAHALHAALVTATARICTLEEMVIALRAAVADMATRLVAAETRSAQHHAASFGTGPSVRG